MQSKKYIITPPSEDEWVLCRERCANFTGIVCACGATIPPDRWTVPLCPEKCPKFKAREGGAA